MEQRKKRLRIPFIADLDRLSLEDATRVLAEKGYSHTISSVNWGNSYSYKPVTTFSVARGKNELFVRFFVHGNCLRAVNSADQTPVQEDSCVGFALQMPDSEHVYDFAFNCIGTCAAYKKTASEKLMLEESLLSQIRRYTDLQHRPFCEMEGIFHWQVMVAIPFRMLGIEEDSLPQLLTGNFYKRADATALPHYLSWTPVKTALPDLAHPDYFGELELE